MHIMATDKRLCNFPRQYLRQRVLGISLQLLRKQPKAAKCVLLAKRCCESQYRVSYDPVAA